KVGRSRIAAGEHCHSSAADQKTAAGKDLRTDKWFVHGLSPFTGKRRKFYPKVGIDRPCSHLSAERQPLRFRSASRGNDVDIRCPAQKQTRAIPTAPTPTV